MFQFVNLPRLDSSASERIQVIVPVGKYGHDMYLLTLTRAGTEKRTALSAYESIRSSGIIAVQIDEGDQLLTAKIVNDKSEVLIGTAQGMSIRFEVADVRPMGRDTRGVRGIDLREGDHVVGMDVIEDLATQQVLCISANGFGKRTPLLRPIEVKEGENTIPLTVTDDWGAGVYVTASVLRPMDVAAGRNPARALGLAYASIDPGKHALKATVETADESAPRGPMDVAVKVEGIEPGESVYVTVAAVDVGILNLTGFKSPDPQGHFFGQRKLGVGIRDVYGRLIDGLNGAQGEVRSGGDAGAQARLQSPPPTEELVAYFSGPLAVGADGYAGATSFDIPSFNGTVRVMAVAWSKTGVGQADKEVLVRDPVVVTASLTRFMAPGDQSRVLDTRVSIHRAG